MSTELTVSLLARRWATFAETGSTPPVGRSVVVGVGTCGDPNPLGILTCVALGDQPAAIDSRTAAHLSIWVVARVNALLYPNGLVHIVEVWEVEKGWCTHDPLG